MESEETIKNKYDAYNKGFEAGKQHSAPSPSTLVFMENIKGQISELKNDFCEFKADIKETLAGLPTDDKMKLFVKEAIDNTLKACDNRYAEKRVEKIINWIAIVIFGALITGAVSLVYKLIEYSIKVSSNI